MVRSKPPELQQPQEFKQWEPPAEETKALNIIPTDDGSQVEKGLLKSPNYAKNALGWRLDSEGNAEFNTVTIRSSQNSFFGDGSDGDVTISTTVSLTRDMCYNNLTITSTGILQPSGYRIFVKGTLTRGGTIRANGGNGGNATTSTGGTAGAAVAAGSLPGGIAGVAGSNGSTSEGGGGWPATAGTSTAKSIGPTAIAGALGGTGGARSDGVGGGPGGTVGTAGTQTGTVYNTPNTPVNASLLFDVYPSLTGFTLAPSNGGSSGAGAGNGTGFGIGGGAGGGGAPGGIAAIFANIVVGSGPIEAKGGNGGNGANGANGTGYAGGGGGGAAGLGGPGGVLILVYGYLETTSGLTVAAGTPGSIGLGGTGNPYAGTNGATATSTTGKMYLIPVGFS